MDGFMNYYENYTPAADVLTISCCIMFFMLIRVAYISKTKAFHFLKHMIIMLTWAAVFDLVFHISMNHISEWPHILIILFRALYHFGLFSILCLSVLYLKETLQIGYKYYKIYYTLSGIGFGLLVIYEILSTIFKFGFYIDDNDKVHMGFRIFPFAYMYFLILLIVMMCIHGKKIYRRVYIGIFASIGLSILVMVVQQICDQSSFTAASFIFPIFTRLYLIHSNPYDLEMGAVSEKSFEDLIDYHNFRKTPLYIMSLYMHDFDGKGRKYPERIQQLTRQFSDRFFNKATMFHISGGHLIMVVRKKTDPEYAKSAQHMYDEFLKLYAKYKIDYKIVYTDSYDELSSENDYINFIRFIHDRISENTIVYACENDVNDYLNYKYITSELADINKCNNPDDERVMVYCQPVYDLKQDRFDTAEALMRLKLPKLGIVPPDMFIPIAEKENYITTLTRIILTKTCNAIKNLNINGFKVLRISVNFSVHDLRSDEFFSSIVGIIKNAGINPDQIAIEITESQNESDFELLKARIEQLKDSGIKFYLDDFGTGYSNFERIMELPFDIVKFDRSLVIASGNSMKYRAMVSHLAEMFNTLDYDVLYEGIENFDDEVRCVNMKANFLQGFKYSRPIPIEALSEFFDK